MRRLHGNAVHLAFYIVSVILFPPVSSLENTILANEITT